MRQNFFIISSGLMAGWIVGMILGAGTTNCSHAQIIHGLLFLAIWFFVLGLVKGKEKP